MQSLALSNVETTLLSAGIAAAISLIVGGLTFWSAHRAQGAESARQDRELARSMTMKLYEQRMAAYPKVWPTTEALRRTVMIRNGAQQLPEYMAETLQKLDEWVAGEAAMMLSSDALEAFYELRESLRVEPAAPTGYSDEQMRRIWIAKGVFRSELRRDVALLFVEEKSIKPPSSVKYEEWISESNRWPETK